LAKKSKLPLDFSNGALIQDETLFSLCQVIEHGWPAGPIFLNALSTLTEAIVLNDGVYFDPMHTWGRSDDRSTSISNAIGNSEFVQVFADENAIRPLPEDALLDKYLIDQGREYSHTDFLLDYSWTYDSFARGPDDDELSRLQLYLEIVQHDQSLLQPERLLPKSLGSTADPTEIPMGKAPEFLRLMLGRSLNLSDSDLMFLEELNFRAKAYFDLARHAGPHLQPFFWHCRTKLEQHVKTNSIAYKLYQRIREKIETLDEPLDTDESEFTRSPIPRLTETLLGHCGDSSKAIAEKLLALRHRYRKFREFLTVYEREWNDASTKDELRQMKQEFDTALKKMVKGENKLSDRFLYNLWDIVMTYEDPGEDWEQVRGARVTNGA
jgi:hypothetical protein